LTKKLCVLTFDMVGSKKVHERGKLQEAVISALATLNRKYRSSLRAGFKMTLGDEFQAAFLRCSDAYAAFKEVRAKIAVGVYCGMGFGEVSTDLSRDPSRMDGPAFHMSRLAVMRAKKQKASLIIDVGDESKNALLNAFASLIIHTTGNWTGRQTEIIGYLEARPDLTQQEVAKHFGISPPAVTKALKTAGWRRVADAEKVLTELMEDEIRVVKT